MTVSVASAPGKFVILGEHAVVYGKPAISLAIDRRFTIKVKRSNEFLINGEPLDLNLIPYIKSICMRHYMIPVSLRLDSTIPSGSGLGSSAALSVALSAAMNSLFNKKWTSETVAREAYEAEYFAQASGSPMDTSASAHGRGIALNIQDAGDHLWTIEKNENRWDISDIDVPEMTFVIGNTGIHAPTGPLVKKVKKYRETNKFASDIVDEIGDISLDGMKAINADDRVELGKLMTANHKLLSILGVSCNELNKLVDVVLPYSYGAKLTGAGGGGCMVALTDKPEIVAKAIESRGGTPYIVKTGVNGVTLE